MVDAATSLPASAGAAIAASAGRGAAGGGSAAAAAPATATAAGLAGPAVTARPAGSVVLRFSLDGEGRGGPAAERRQDTGRSDAAERPDEGAAEAARRKVQKLRTRLDPETLRLFTEVIDPVTREALYRVPPTAISEAAEREGEFLARYERMASALALEPSPRPAAMVEA